MILIWLKHEFVNLFLVSGMYTQRYWLCSRGMQPHSDVIQRARNQQQKQTCYERHDGNKQQSGTGARYEISSPESMHRKLFIMTMYKMKTNQSCWIRNRGENWIKEILNVNQISFKCNSLRKQITPFFNQNMSGFMTINLGQDLDLVNLWLMKVTLLYF